MNQTETYGLYLYEKNISIEDQYYTPTSPENSRPFCGYYDHQNPQKHYLDLQKHYVDSESHH